MNTNLKKLLGVAVMSILACTAECQYTPVLFSEQSLTGNTANRKITLTPDVVQNPLWYGTNLVPTTPIVLQPVGGQVVTNLAVWGYTVFVDNWPRSIHIQVPVGGPTPINVVSLINTNQFSPLNLFQGPAVGPGGAFDGGLLTNIQAAAIVPPVSTNSHTVVAGNNMVVTAVTNANGAVTWTVAGTTTPNFTAMTATGLGQFGSVSGNGSALTGLTASQIGGLMTNVISPRTYGAVMDGVTDDTVAWSNTVVAVNNAGGLAPTKIDFGGRKMLITQSPAPVSVDNVEICNGSLLTPSTNIWCIGHLNSHNNFWVHDMKIYRCDVNGAIGTGLAILPPFTNSYGIWLGTDGWTGPSQNYWMNCTIDRCDIANFWRDIVVGGTTELSIKYDNIWNAWSNNIYWAPNGASPDMEEVSFCDINQADSAYGALSPLQKTNVISMQVDSGNLGLLIGFNNGGGCKQLLSNNARPTFQGLKLTFIGGEYEQFWTVNTNMCVISLTNATVAAFNMNANWGPSSFGSSNYLATFGLYNCAQQDSYYVGGSYPSFDIFNPGLGNQTFPLVQSGTWTFTVHNTFGDAGTHYSSGGSAQSTVPNVYNNVYWYASHGFYKPVSFADFVELGRDTTNNQTITANSSKAFDLLYPSSGGNTFDSQFVHMDSNDGGGGSELHFGGGTGRRGPTDIYWDTAPNGSSAAVDIWHLDHNGNLSPFFVDASIGTPNPVDGVTATNFTTAGTGQFSGNGAGLTNLPPSAIASSKSMEYDWAMNGGGTFNENPGGGGSALPGFFLSNDAIYGLVRQSGFSQPFVTIPRYVWHGLGGTNMVVGITIGSTNADTWTYSVSYEYFTNSSKTSMQFIGQNCVFTTPATTNMATYLFTNALPVSITNAERGMGYFQLSGGHANENLWLVGGFFQTQ